MKKKLPIKETFALALQNHQKNNLRVAENLYNETLKTNPNHFEAIFFLGTLSAQFKKFDMAKQLFNKAIKIQPNYVHSYINLGNVLNELREHQKAISCYEKAIQINPNLLPAYDNLGIVFKEIGEHQKAISCYENAIQINPNYAAAYNNLGLLFGKLKEFKKAQNCCENAIKINPNYAAAHYNLGLIFLESGEHQKGIRCYQKAIKIQPNHINAHNNLGISFQELGEFKKAISCYQKALKYESGNLTYLYQLSGLKKEILNSKLKNKINKIMKGDNCTKKNLAYGNFLLAKYELNKKNYKKIFNYLIKGHQCYFDSESKKFNKGIDYCFNELPKIKKLISANQFNKNIEKINYKIKPIFIFGVPRCGSTLVEKVIASGANHIPIGEETSIFGNLVRQRLHQKQELNSNIINFRTKIIKQYKQKGLIQEKSNYTFTDKSLDNFFYIDLIREVFPHAKMIDCRRNALSSIMSILKNNLIDISWAHSLKYIFKYFDIYYKTIESYKKIFPNFIYELQLEKFINDPETESKKLLKFCDLSWDKKCLEFYKRKDLISKTTSNVQIRKAINKDSINEYLPYKQFLNKSGNKYSWFS